MKIKVLRKFLLPGLFISINLSLGLSQEPAGSAKDKNQAPLTDKRSRAPVKSQVLFKEVPEILSDVEEILTLFSSDGGTQAPLKVRGGSMTFFTLHGWKTAGPSFCSSVDASLISVKRFLGADGLPISSGRVPNVTVPWTINIFGHIPLDSANSKRGDPSSNGVMVQSSAMDCDGNANKSSVTISLISQDATSAFYPAQLKTTSGRSEKRFFDQSANCMGEPQRSGKGDRDYCERIAEIDIVLPAVPGATPPFPATTYKLYCPDGDCSLDIGKPE